jgi:RND family efflux transporter MFP subunit
METKMHMPEKINNNRLSNFKIAIALLLVCSLAFSLTGCFLLPEDEVVLASPVQLKEPQNVNISTEVVKRGDIVNRVRFWAEFLSPKRTDLQITNMGRLKNIYFSVNDYVKAGDVVAELESGDLETQFQSLQINLEKAQLNYDKIKTENDITGGSDYQLEDAKLSIDLAKVQLDNVKAEIAKTKIIAPASGIVSYIDQVEIGDSVQLRTTFMTISDRSQIELVAKYVKGGMDSLAVGMKAKVNFNSKDYTGQIIKGPLDEENEKLQDFTSAFIIKVEGLDVNTVTLDDTAEVECILAQATNAIIIKKANIIPGTNKKQFVHILENGAIKEREIETGIDDGTYVEIKKGITEGEAIVIL